MSVKYRQLTISHRKSRLRRARRGQTLIIAIAVMFILLFLGGVFITQIARNLASAARSRDTSSAQAFAELGIRYCDDQLVNSPDGADWRPAPTGPILTPSDPLGLTDPDYQWLSQGFTRLYSPGGRSLVRIVYDPHPDDPRSQLIRIESIGRSGELGQGLDPTVFVQRGNAPQLRREMIGYKQIGLTDYLMYVTHNDRRAQESFIGSPDIGASTPSAPAHGLDTAVIFNDPTVTSTAQYPPGPTGVNGNEYIIGGAMRFNGNLRIGGEALFYFSPRGTSVFGRNTSFEGLQVSGNIALLPTRNVDNGNSATDGILNDNDLQSFVNLPYVAGSLGGQTPDPSAAIRSSTDPNFSTVAGLVRDGLASSDVNGYARGVPRLDPPIFDTYVNGSGVLRYRALTRDSGTWYNAAFNSGERGYGRGIYVDNFLDQQKETAAPGVSGGFSLRGEWLNSAGSTQGHWSGPVYRAPGVLIELLGNKIRLTRSDGQVFLKPNGDPINGGTQGVTSGSGGGNVLMVPLADAARKQFKFPDGTAYVTITGGDNLPVMAHDGDEPDPNGLNKKPFGDKYSYGVNVVIMAEGNVRVKGVYGAVTDPGVVDEQLYNVDTPNESKLKLGRVHLTIVSGGTAYVEGNVVKGDGYVQGGTIHLERASTCAILAKDYVCVNTTTFMSAENQSNAWRTTSPDLSDYYMELGLTRPALDTTVSFGVPVDAYTTAGSASPEYLMVRHAAQGDDSGQGQTFINLLINPAKGIAGGGTNSSALYPFNQSALLPETYALSDPLSEVAPNFERRAFALRLPNGNPIGTPNPIPIVATPGFDNLFRFQIDRDAAPIESNTGSQDYLFGGAMVTPLDIRIEAILYAQEKSFFVIPGFSFNPDANDTLQNFQATGIRPSYTGRERTIVQQQGGTANELAVMALKNAFPFYNQPLDVRITICGAVAQNYTASSGDQAAWMKRWAYIPGQYGNTNQFVPDDHLRGHDSVVSNSAWDVNYNYAEDRTPLVDFRTYQEQKQNIAHGLRFVYDPSLAMPYLRPTSVNTYASSATRSASALRYIRRPDIVDAGNNLVLQGVIQTLPAAPRLPVCPGLLYFGSSDRPIAP